MNKVNARFICEHPFENNIRFAVEAHYNQVTKDVEVFRAVKITEFEEGKQSFEVYEDTSTNNAENWTIECEARAAFYKANSMNVSDVIDQVYKDYFVNVPELIDQVYENSGNEVSTQTSVAA